MKVPRKVKERVKELKRKKFSKDEIKKTIEREFSFKIFASQIDEILKRKSKKPTMKVPFEFRGKQYELTPYLFEIFLIGERVGWNPKKMKKAGIKYPSQSIYKLRKIIKHPPYELTFKSRLQELKSKKSRKFAK